MSPPAFHPGPRAAPRRARQGAAQALWLPLLIAFLVACQGQARAPVDCDQMLNEGKYQAVIENCEDPFQLSSAYMGAGGFDMFLLAEDTAADGKVALLLGLTTANINERRLLFNKAVEAVNPPKGGSQAFALLVASFLGLGVTTSQYLDNGIGGDAALNDNYDALEVAGAVSFTLSGGFGLTVLDSVNHYAVRYGGKSYVFDCTAATIPCGSGGTQPLVYDDPDGSGILNSAPGESADKATVLANLAAITSAGRVVQLQNVDIGFTLSAATEEPTKSYLGRHPTPVTYDMGLSTYLTGLTRATDELEAATGSTGGSDVTAQINAITAQLDNGGTCSGSTPQVNQLGLVYLAAAGTISNPASGSYDSQNLVAVADIPNLIAAAPALFPTINAANLGFTVNYYKLIFSTAAALGAYDVTQATPRVDAAYSAFQSRFEDVWLFSPGASPAGDNQVNVAEVLCSAD